MPRSATLAVGFIAAMLAAFPLVLATIWLAFAAWPDESVREPFFDSWSAVVAGLFLVALAVPLLLSARFAVAKAIKNGEWRFPGEFYRLAAFFLLSVGAGIAARLLWIEPLNLFEGDEKWLTFLVMLPATGSLILLLIESSALGLSDRLPENPVNLSGRSGKLAVLLATLLVLTPSCALLFAGIDAATVPIRIININELSALHLVVGAAFALPGAAGLWITWKILAQLRHTESRPGPTTR